MQLQLCYTVIEVIFMYRDLTKGSITKGLVLFALPMMAGNLLQQLYNIADTLIVGQALGKNALAAVGSAYTLMTFLTSIFIGFSIDFILLLAEAFSFLRNNIRNPLCPQAPSLLVLPSIYLSHLSVRQAYRPIQHAFRAILP